MFPLPVGDLVQTLQADRERRFTTFLRMLHVSGLEDTLTGKLKIQAKTNLKELGLCHTRLSCLTCGESFRKSDGNLRRLVRKAAFLGPKTFTVFAPTDSAFTDASTKNGAPIWTDEDGPEAAKALISRHVMPTTLYTAGMRYYIQKDSLRPQSPVHIHKNGGKRFKLCKTGVLIIDPS